MAKKQSKRQPERVEIVYQRGKKRYLLLNGMVSWGLATGLIFLTLQSFWNHGLSFSAWRTTLFSLQALGVIGLFLAAGLLWGALTWSMVEKQATQLGGQRKKKPNRQNQAAKPS